MNQTTGTTIYLMRMSADSGQACYDGAALREMGRAIVSDRRSIVKKVLLELVFSTQLAYHVRFFQAIQSYAKPQTSL